MKVNQKEKKQNFFWSDVQEVPTKTKRGFAFSMKPKMLLLAFCLVVGLFVPMGALWAATITPNYDWYTNYDSTNEFVISSAPQLEAFARVVNGEAVIGDKPEPARDFAGKTVKLNGNLNFSNNELTPIGTEAKPFKGIFDGNSHAINNVRILVGNKTSDLGIFGKAGTGSVIKNLTLGSGVSLSIVNTNPGVCLKNIGLLVGNTEGSVSNCTNNGSLFVQNRIDQTAQNVFPIMNVGGLIGIGLGDISGCSNNGTVTVKEDGKPLPSLEQSVLVVNIGGVVGNAGALDSSFEKQTDGRYGAISNCNNTGKLVVDTPEDAGSDRFGNKVFVQSSNVGGIAGYSRGSISACTNSGYLRAENASTFGGVAGSVRAKITTSTYNGNFTSADTDDGMVQGAPALLVSNCTNSGWVYGYSHVGGIVGRSGTYVDITACLNMADAKIVGTRHTKPFPAGIAGGSYGTVSYSSNLGTVASGKWNNETLGTLTLQGGYYAAGIVGNTNYFTELDYSGVRVTPLPEVYGCYNAGLIQATAGMRQHHIVGDNAGYVYNCVAVDGLCNGNKMVYGDGPDDNESAGGTFEKLYVVSAATLKNNGFIDKEETFSPLSLMNAFGDSDGWQSYWVKNSSDAINGGYPALNRQIQATHDISMASVAWAENAQYTGTASVPKASVVLSGQTLIQGTDYKVVPQAGAVAVTSEGQRPYEASVVGLGLYYGTATQKFMYGIGKGDLAKCTALVNSKQFNWEAHLPSKDEVRVENLACELVDPSHFSLSFDSENPNLVDGKAVNAKDYYIKITANADSDKYYGSVVGQFNIKQAKIVNDKDEQKRKENAYVEEIEYLGTTHNWQSLTIDPDVVDADLTFTAEYTGYPIRPTVSKITYLDRQLTEGKDFRVVYGGDTVMEGSSTTPEEENLGVKGGSERGLITARYISGGNFSNYDNMPFMIVDTAAKNNISGAVFKDSKGKIIDSNYQVIFEAGSTYEPVEVWFAGSKITEGKDYSAVYTNNNKLGTVTFAITGMGDNFEGAKQGTFKIVEGVSYTFTFGEYNEAAKTVTVTGVNYEGSNASFDMVIPATTVKDGVTYSVTAIGDRAFGGSGAADFIGSETNLSKGKIASVVIPPSVQRIGDYAFSSSSSSVWNQLASVTFDDITSSQLTSIGGRAFLGCGNLEEFAFPPKVATIGAAAFQTGVADKPSKLHTLTFMTEDPKLPSSIGLLAFSGVGWDSKEVKVNGYEFATAVKAFASSNGGANNGTHGGRNFTFHPLEVVSVTFNSLGGSAVSPVVVPEGAKLNKPTDPTRVGYVFSGWYMSEDGGVTFVGEAFDFTNTTITESIILFAKWTLGEEPAIWDGLVDTSWYNANATELTISSARQLAGFAQIVNGVAVGIEKDNFAGKTVTLANDIYLNASTSSARNDGQNVWIPIGAEQFNHGTQQDPYNKTFNGTFNGAGHIIHNIYIYGPTAPFVDQDDLPQYGGNQGLFGALGNGAVVQDLGITGFIQGRVAGGIAATTAIQLDKGEQKATIIRCFNAATVLGDGSGDRGTGGIFGGQDRNTNWMTHVDIIDCYNAGKVSAISGNTIASVGGIAGVCKGEIINCYSRGQVIKGRVSAALSGSTGIGTYTNHALMAGGTITNSYGLQGASELLYAFENRNEDLVESDFVDAASSFKNASELKTMAAVLGEAWADDNGSINDGFPILLWQAGAVNTDPTVLSIFTQASAEATPVLAYEVKQSEIDVLLQTGSVSSMHWSNNNWSVNTTNSYVTLSDIFGVAGLSVKPTDSVKAAAGDGFSATRTWEEMTGGFFFPDAGVGSFEQTGAIAVEPVLAFTYAGTPVASTASAAASANAAKQSTSGAPRLTYGNLPQNFNSEGVSKSLCAGNRFVSGVSNITVISAASEGEITVSVVGTEGTFGYSAGALSVTATATVPSGGSVDGYQWYTCDANGDAGAIINNATSATYSIPAGLAAGNYHYFCAVNGKSSSGTAMTVTSGIAKVVVKKAPRLISIVDDPANGRPAVLLANSNSVTLYPAIPTMGDGDISYAVSATNSVPMEESKWQSATTFGGLEANTTYYVFAKVSETQNYLQAISSGFAVSTKAAGFVETPVLAPRSFDPKAKLSSIALPEGWIWAPGTENDVPQVVNGGYFAVFIPVQDDGTDYSSAEGYDQASGMIIRAVPITINKTSPVITASPTAAGISYGQSLAASALSGGSAIFVSPTDGSTYAIPGYFAWKTAATIPSVSDSNTTAYAVKFVPTGSDGANYLEVETSATLTVSQTNPPAGNNTNNNPPTVSTPSNNIYYNTPNNVYYYNSNPSSSSNASSNSTGENATAATENNVDEQENKASAEEKDSTKTSIDSKETPLTLRDASDEKKGFEIPLGAWIVSLLALVFIGALMASWYVIKKKQKQDKERMY